MRSIIKRWLIAGAAAVMALGVLTACTKVTEKKEDKEPATAEDLPVAETLKNGEEPEADDADAQGTEPEKSTDAEENGELPASADGGDTFHYINEDKDLYGDIWEVGEGQFSVTEIYVETEEGGGEIMAMQSEETAGEAPKITVVYDENTKFVRQTIRDGGASHEEREGTAADLKKGLTAEMNGSWEGDVFHAAEILIVEVILN